MQQYKSIEIDLEVYKLIEANRKSFAQTENEILREILNLKPEIKRIRSYIADTGLDIGDGVLLPEGSVLRKKYKGQVYEVEVRGGQILYNGKGYTSPSGAAVAVTGSSVNGWTFWEVKRPNDGDFKLLDSLRTE